MHIFNSWNILCYYSNVGLFFATIQNLEYFMQLFNSWNILCNNTSWNILCNYSKFGVFYATIQQLKYFVQQYKLEYFVQLFKLEYSLENNSIIVFFFVKLFISWNILCNFSIVGIFYANKQIGLFCATIQVGIFCAAIQKFENFVQLFECWDIL